VARAFIAESSAPVFAVNSLLLYAFLPLPVLLASSLLLQQWRSLALGGVLCAAWCWLYGPLFWPHGEPLADRPRLAVLSFNALGLNHDVHSTVELVRASRADVVALQELNPEAAAALERELGGLYPYRWLEPRVGVTGGGLLSKLPFSRSPSQLAGSWVDPPMVVDVDVRGQPVTVVRFHATSHPRHWREREEQARILAARAAQLRTRFILAGDLTQPSTTRLTP
jgi:vancomycin resistance protein VanJ